MNGVLENLAKGIANAVAPNDPDVKIFNAQSEITRLKEEEEKLFAEIGKKVIEAGEGEKYGEIFIKINNKKEEIKVEEENLKIAKAAKEAAEAEKNLSSNICPNCGTENGSEVKFCSECGTKLESVTVEPKKMFCTNCGTENKDGTKFCVNCGNKFN